MKAKPKRKSASVSNKRKKPTFKLPKLVDDPILADEIRESFKRAFFVKEMKYSTQLVYDDKDCPLSKNNPSLEQKV